MKNICGVLSSCSTWLLEVKEATAHGGKLTAPRITPLLKIKVTMSTFYGMPIKLSWLYNGLAIAASILTPIGRLQSRARVLVVARTGFSGMHGLQFEG